jgi:hypothetical protein
MSLQEDAHLRDQRVGVERFDDVVHCSQGVGFCSMRSVLHFAS